MSRHVAPRGYTIIESLIFIVVSGLLMTFAVTAVNGRQAQIQFEQGVRDLDADIRATINDVASGYFPDTTFSCINDPANADNVTISGGGQAQGTRSTCMFAGKAVTVNNAEEYSIDTIAGARVPIASELNLSNSKLTHVPDLGISTATSWGLQIERVVNRSADEVRYVAFLNGVEVASGLGGLESGAQSVSAFYSTQHDINQISSTNLPLSLDTDDSIYYCLSANDDTRKAVIIVGESGRQLTTTIDQDAEGKYEAQCGW